MKASVRNVGFGVGNPSIPGLQCDCPCILLRIKALMFFRLLSYFSYFYAVLEIVAQAALRFRSSLKPAAALAPTKS